VEIWLEAIAGPNQSLGQRHAIVGKNHDLHFAAHRPVAVNGTSQVIDGTDARVISQPRRMLDR
jgi:hypothetical protein